MLALSLLAVGDGGCTGCPPPPADGGVPDAGPRSLVVVVNEVLAKNDNGIVDESVERDDWIELYNPGDDDVDLAGFGLSDDPAELAKSTLPDGTVLAAGGFLLLWADNQPEQGARHLAFRLAAGGESVVVTDGAGGLVDLVSFGPQEADVSIGRSPDGDEDGLVPLVEPTPGAANAEPRGGAHDDGGAAGDAGALARAPVINEVVTSPTEAVLDEGGAAVTAAWVELFNPHDDDVALAGLFLSPNDAFPSRWAIPATLAPLPPGGFALFFLDDDEGAGADHAGFELGAGIGQIAVASPAGDVLDLAVFASAPAGLGYGRVPDGEGDFTTTTPTPRAANVAAPDAGGEGEGDDAGAPPADAGSALDDGGAALDDGGAVDGGDAG